MPTVAVLRSLRSGTTQLGRFGRLLFLVAALVTPLAAQGPAPGLQPGDVVRLKIWREPDLSGDNQVDEGGNVVFPKLGPMRVTNLPADSLKRILVQSYTTYLRDPSIEVTLLRRVNVLGAVRSPGLYQVDQTQTIGDVLAQAGGATGDGKPDQVELRRAGSANGIKLQRNTQLFSAGLQSGDQIWVPQRSWFGRNTTTLVGAGITATAIIVATVIKP